MVTKINTYKVDWVNGKIDLKTDLKTDLKSQKLQKNDKNCI